jgi:hypothetical protein
MAGVELEESSSATITNAVFRYGNASVADGLYAPCGTAGDVDLSLTDSILAAPMMLGTCPDRGSAKYLISGNSFEVPSTAFAALQFNRGASDSISMKSNWFDFAGSTGVTRAIWTDAPVGISLSGSTTNTFAPGTATTLLGVGGDVPAGTTYGIDLPARVALAASSGAPLEANGTVTIGAGTTIGSSTTGVLELAVEQKGSLQLDGTAAAPVSMVANSGVNLGSGTLDVTHAVFSGTESSSSSGTESSSSSGNDVVEGGCEAGAEHVLIEDSTFDAGIQLGQCATANSEDLRLIGNRVVRPSGSQFVRLTSPVSDPGGLVMSNNTFAASSIVAAQPQPAVWVDQWPVQGIDLAGAGTNRFSGSGTNRVIDVVSASIPAKKTWTVGPSGGAILAPWSGAGYGPGLLLSGKLVLDAGSVVKTVGGDGIDVQPGGALDALGTSRDLVTFTSIEDSTIDGDSNGDGPAVGTPAGKGGNYGAAITANEDTVLDLAYAQFRDGLWAVNPPYNATPVSRGSATITHCRFAEELELGDTNGTQVGYKATVTHSIWTFDGAPSGQFAAGGGYDPAALQPAVYLANIDPSGFSLSGATANTFKGTGAGRVVALLGTTIPSGRSWTVSPSTGVVLAPWPDYDYLPDAGVTVFGSLTLDPKTVIKSDTQTPGIEVGASGTLDVTKSTFTAIADDTVDGDSNGDGSKSAPALGSYGAAITFGDVLGGSTVTGDHIRYAERGIDSPDGGNIDISYDTFLANQIAVDVVAGLTTTASVDDDTFSGNTTSIQSASTWSTVTASPLACQFVAEIGATGNTYAGGTKPLVTDSDYAAIKAALLVPKTESSPDGWTDDIAPGATDDLSGWGVLPCADVSEPKDSYVAVAIPLDFGS